MATSSSSTIAKYPYPSQVDITQFANVMLTTVNYSKWKSLMALLIESQGLLGFINATVPMPPERMAVPDGTEVDNPDYQAWLRSDELLRSWILCTLEQDAIALVEHSKTAEEMWRKLEAEWPLTVAASNMPLYKATVKCDWKSAKKFLKEKPAAVRASITDLSETALIVAAYSTQSGKGNQFMKELIELMEPDDLAKPDSTGYTALHAAATVGNIEAAKLLVGKNSNLPNLCDANQSLPLHEAAEYCGHYGKCHRRRGKEMVEYLLDVTKRDGSVFQGTSGIKLMYHLIRSELYDIALWVAKQHSNLAYVSGAILLAIAKNRSSFLSGTHLNLLQRLIYTYVPVVLKDFALIPSGGDIGSTTQGDFETQGDIEMLSTTQGDIESTTQSLISAPQIKNIRDQKIIHHQALQLVKHLCKEVAKLNYAALPLLTESLEFAACAGIHEVAEEILDSYPIVAYTTTDLKETIIHLAIKHRREKVYNLIYQCREGKRKMFFVTADSKKNYCLHLAGNLESKQKVSLKADAAGAALQMQRELQWFKEVEKHTRAENKESMNIEEKTPAMLFTETHEALVKEGEKWMKDTANSCTIVAALIVTIVFAAAITVPGGNNSDNGLPIFSKQKAFVFFAISDALALFSSTSSLLMFLSILTSRYGEEDFLYALPKRLIIALATLFVSIISMMMAFGAILFLVFGHKKTWMLIPVAALSGIPVSLFASLQFPLLLDMIKSTYGPGIFGKQSDRLLV